MIVEKARPKDINALVELRLAYLQEDNGKLEEETVRKIRQSLPKYYRDTLNKDLFVYLIRENEEIVSCAFLLVVIKPMSPSFINGKTGTVLNVYTRPAARRKGYARKIMNTLIEDAAKMALSRIELKATEDGYPLYKAVGFLDDHEKYHNMTWIPQTQITS
ncbi:MAG: GNAT family N-acetyltransferase [Firmicutes bacterium]|nr:GNAT family N-acetyltransferase [Bacillota bacterium]